MNDEDPKPGVVIDVTPEQETAAGDNDNASVESPAAEDKPEKARSQGSSLPLIVAVLALLAVLAAAGMGYRYWTQLTADLASIDARLRDASQQQQQLQQSVSSASEAVRAQEAALGKQREVLDQQSTAVDEARGAFEQQEQQLAEENLRLQEREAELRAAVADVHRRVGRSGTQWMIAETEYLLRIASHRLTLARDTKTARIALELADQRLRDTKDPGWAGVREQIARDIAKLSSFEAPDSAGMSARLAALAEQIPQLKIASATIGPERTLPESDARLPQERSWETLLDDVWAGFKNSVRIRERDKPVQAMLAPEHQFFLYENLKLHLESARLGLARNDQALFRDNLQIAGDWLGKYFAPEQGAAKALREAIDHMLTVEIQPEVPDVSQSLRALKVRQKLMEDIAPSGVEEQ